MKKYLDENGKRTLTEKQFNEVVQKLCDSGEVQPLGNRVRKTDASPFQWAQKKMARKDYYARNREAVIERNTHFVEENKEATAVYKKKHYAENQELYKKRSSESYERRYADPEQREKILEDGRKSYHKNIDKQHERSRKYREKNAEKELARGKKYRENNRDIIKERSKTEEAKATRNKYQKKKRATDPVWRMSVNIRVNIADAMRRGQVATKHGSAMDCGLSPKGLWEYMCSKLSGKMTPDNYGSVWHVDHIYPVNATDLNDPAQFKAVCHYTNLQPMIAVENTVKKDKVTPAARRMFNKLVKQFSQDQDS